MQTSSDSEELRLEEWPRRTDSAAVAHSRPWLWLAAAVALLPFANGANNIPLTAWLAPGVSAAICAQGKSQRLGCWQAYILLVAAFRISSSEGWCQSQERDTYVFLFCVGSSVGFCRMRLTGF